MCEQNNGLVCCHFKHNVQASYWYTLPRLWTHDQRSLLMAYQESYHRGSFREDFNEHSNSLLCWRITIVLKQIKTDKQITVINPRRTCARGLRYLLLCVCVCVYVCVCEESTALQHRFYDEVRSIAPDCSLRFQDFQLTELSDVISFTSYRYFRSSSMIAANFTTY